MLVQEKIVFVFNKILINFFKEIKKEKYFKLAIKKHYRSIDKKSPTYIESFNKKVKEFSKLFIDIESEKDEFTKKLIHNADFSKVNIFKNINVKHLFQNFKEELDKYVIISYILTLYLFSHLYEESLRIKLVKEEDKNVEEIVSSDDEDNDNKDNDDDDKDNDDGNDEDNDEVEEDDNNDDEDYNNDDDNENGNYEDDDGEDDEDEDEEKILDDLLIKTLNILNQIDMNMDVTDSIDDILDDDIKNILLNIRRFKVTNNTNNTPIDIDNNLDSLIGDSEIGKLAKEISDQVNLDSLNLENPEDITNLFNSDTGNLLGNLVQQVGSSITEKISSGELKQDDLVKDAFSLMNKMQTSQSSNPVLNNMMNSMMNNQQNSNSNTTGNTTGNTSGNSDNENTDNMEDMMKEMMNGDMMQQMMNSMGGTQALNQNNPNSREGKAKQRLRKKLEKKKNNN